MARSRGDTEFLNDLETFCKICESLKRQGGSASFGSISDELGIPASTLQSCRLRLEEEMGGKPLIHSLSRSGNNTLAEEGRLLFERASELITRLRSIRQSPFSSTTIIRLAGSQTLLVHLLPVVMRRFLHRQRLEARDVTLRIEDNHAPEETVRRIKGGELDFAIVWDIEGREAMVAQGGLVYYKLAREFDLVVVCGLHHRFAERLGSPSKPVHLEELAQETLLCLPTSHQILSGRLPPSTQGGERILVDHFSRVIEILRAGHKGCAVVPGLYRELDYYRKTGDLIHLPLARPKSDPIAKRSDSKPYRLGVAAMFRGQTKKKTVEGERPTLEDYCWPTKDAPAGELLIEVDKYLQNTRALTCGWDVPFETIGVAKAFHRLGKFTYVWYVWIDEVGLGRPRWLRSRVKFRADGKQAPRSAKLGEIAFEGTNEEYELAAELVGKTILLRGTSKYDSGQFLATLNMSLEREGITVLAGTWTGKDHSNQPLSGPFLLATGEISDEAIVQINRAAMLRCLMNVNLDGFEIEIRTPPG